MYKSDMYIQTNFVVFVLWQHMNMAVLPGTMKTW